MEPYIKSVLDILQNILAQIGVEKVSLPFAAMLTLYILVTLLILLLVMLVWWFGRRKNRLSTKTMEDARVATVAAATESIADTIVTEPVETTSAFVDDDSETQSSDIGIVKTVRSGLVKTRASLVGRLESLFKQQQVFSPELLEELEEVLITADFGMATTVSLVNSLEQRFLGADATSAEVYDALKEEISSLIKAVDCSASQMEHELEVIMVVGVNGVGKTTTIGKLASQYTAKGKSVMLAAGDTFRAAAAEQLSIWAQRAGADIVRHSEGGDPAAVTFDAAKAAIARKSKVLIVDTAGRLHTKTNLMEELKKVRRVLDREIPGAPHQTLLVVDATTGQNALVQAKAFQAEVQVDGIVLTKLDGTAKGGVIVAISSELNIPVRYVGVGEGLHDLRPFDPDEYAEALFGKDEVA
jgi:fused signal recognition particle receptor